MTDSGALLDKLINETSAISYIFSIPESNFSIIFESSNDNFPYKSYKVYSPSLDSSFN